MPRHIKKLAILSIGAAVSSSWAFSFACSYGITNIIAVAVLSCLLGGMWYLCGYFASREMRSFVILTTLLFDFICLAFGLGASATWIVNTDPRLDPTSYPAMVLIVAVCSCFIALLVWSLKCVTKQSTDVSE